MKIFSTAIGAQNNQNYKKIQAFTSNNHPNQDSKVLCSDLARLNILGRSNLLNIKQNPKNFFIEIEGYGKDEAWAKQMAAISNNAANMILDGKSFSDTTSYIAKEYKDWADGHIEDRVKAANIGELRLNEGSVLLTACNKQNKYGAYLKKYEKFLNGKNSRSVERPKEYPKAATVHIIKNKNGNGEDIIHFPRGIIDSYKYCDEIYSDLVNNYAGKNLSKKDIKQINKQMGSLHWLMAHGTFWKRGSDAITNSLIKALYSALNFETYPPKTGISFDLEAFCTEHKNFIKKYTQLYSNTPKYINFAKQAAANVL